VPVSTRRVASKAALLVAAVLLPGCLPLGVAFHPDGKRVAAVVSRHRDDEGVEREQADLRVISLEDGSSVSVAVGRYMSSPCWTPDGKRLVFFLAPERKGGDDAPRLCTWDGERVTDRATGWGKDWDSSLSVAPCVSPDGRTVHGTDAVEGRAIVAAWDLATGTRRVVADPGAMPVLSPRGDLLAYLLPPDKTDGEAVLSVITVPGGERRVLFALSEVPIMRFAWSPDGTRVAATAQGRWKTPDGQPGPEIVVSDPVRGGRRGVSVEGEPAFFPCWSTDGKTLYFTARRTERWRVRRVAAEGGNVSDVPGGSHAFVVGVSRDGKRLLLRTSGRGDPTGSEEIAHGFLRLLDPATGETKDLVVSDSEFRDLAAAEIGRAGDPGAKAEDAPAAGRRALEALDRMAKRFPGSADLSRSIFLRAAAGKLLEPAGKK